MKRRIILIPFILILFVVLFLSSCNSNEPTCEFSDVNYDTTTNVVSFNLIITDSEVVGSNYSVHIKQTDGKSDFHYEQEIKKKTKTEYSFSDLAESTTYTLYVTCDYNNNNCCIKNSYTFTTGANTTISDTNSIANRIGITYSNETITYDGKSHYTLASYQYSGQTIDILNGQIFIVDGTSYYITYDSSNAKIIPGSYTQKMYICKRTPYSSNSLVETLTSVLTITKALSIYDFSDYTVEYTGSSIEMPYTASGLTYKYFDSNNKEIQSIITPGTYKVKYTFTGNAYYQAKSGDFNVYVTKANIVSNLSDQTTTLNSNGTASFIINSQAFSIGNNLKNFEYDIKYYDKNNTLIDTDYVTNVGTYTVKISISEGEYYNSLELSYKLYVVDEISDESILVSNIEYFSYNYVSGKNNFLYIDLYNGSNEAVDLANIKFEIDGNEISISGTINPFDSYVVLLYSNRTKLSEYNRFSLVTYDYTQYADLSINYNISSVSNIKITKDNLAKEYNIETTYSDYCAYLSDRNNNTFTYSTFQTLKEAANNVQKFAYTIVSPTITSNIDYNTISISRLNSLYEDVVAKDALGNQITITSDFVDVSSINNDNIGKLINITYNISDKYGNKSSLVLAFTLIDEEGPIIELSDEAKSNISTNDNIDLTKYFTAYDYVDGIILITSDMIDDGGLSDASIAGVYTIVVSVSDSYGNVSKLSMKIYVDTNNLTFSNYSNSETIKSDLTGQANAMPSVGDVKVLVIPIFFNSNNATAQYIGTLNKVFNDTTGQIGLGSVKSYYQEASYSKLNLSFDIFSNEYYIASKQYKYYDTSTRIYELLLDALEVCDKYYNLADYDSDNDGVIDAVWFIYDIDYDSSTNYFWAWTSDLGSAVTSKFDEVSVGKVCFASYEFSDASDSYYASYNDSTSKSGLTARTYIHETGHLLGLYDYYDYDYNLTVGYHHTMYGISLMDKNYGDLDAASKLLLGWIDPIVVSDNDIVTIGSTSTTGDAIVIAKEYNLSKGLFGEYVILEFWNGDGLNSFDKSYTFGANNYGIRVLHLDTTINYVNGKPTLTTGSRPTYFKYNNTDDDEHNLLETLAYEKLSTYDSSTQTYTTIGTILFEDTKTVFGKDIYSDFEYNSGQALDFTFQIKKLSSSSATIYISFN